MLFGRNGFYVYIIWHLNSTIPICMWNAHENIETTQWTGEKKKKTNHTNEMHIKANDWLRIKSISISMANILEARNWYILIVWHATCSNQSMANDFQKGFILIPSIIKQNALIESICNHELFNKPFACSFCVHIKSYSINWNLITVFDLCHAPNVLMDLHGWV